MNFMMFWGCSAMAMAIFFTIINWGGWRYSNMIDRIEFFWAPLVIIMIMSPLSIAAIPPAIAIYLADKSID